MIIGPYDFDPVPEHERIAHGKRMRESIRRLYQTDDTSENGLLRLIEDAADGGEERLRRARFALDGLYGVVTPTAIPVLKRAAFFPSRYLKEGAVDLIAHIAGSDESAFYLSLLEDKRYPHKPVATALLGLHGGRGAVPAVVRRAKAVLRSNRSIAPQAAVAVGLAMRGEG